MSAGKHTPGPWVLNGRAVEEDKGRRARVVAYVEEENNDDNEANARLIAAAPDLLAEHIEACDLLNALVGAMPPALQKKWPNLVRRSIEMSSKRAAIAKAVGK